MRFKPHICANRNSFLSTHAALTCFHTLRTVSTVTAIQT
jgi:hypothetical protein